MDTLLAVALGIIIVLLLVVIVKVSGRRSQEIDPALIDAIGRIQQGAQELSRQVSARLDDLNRQLGAIKSLSQQMEQFQRFLTAPRRRGALGEVFLEEILAEVLPREMFSLQDTQIAPGIRPDAVIYSPQGKICVDSKFPADNYLKMISAADEEHRRHFARQFSRDLRGHIQKVAGYVLPDAGTTDFAVMYIPAESVFTYIVENDPEILRDANARGVLLTSPHTFYYFLHIVLTALRQQIAQERAKEIIGRVEGLVESTKIVVEVAEKTQRHLSHAHRSMSDLVLALKDLLRKIESTAKMEE